MGKIDKKEIRKNEIIRDSIKIMYLKGYNSTSVKNIVDAAGIPKGSFYNYFKDKEQYAVDAVRYYETVIIKDLIDLLSEVNVDPLKRIYVFFEGGKKHIMKNDYKLGCFAGNLAQEMGGISRKISDVIEDFYDNFVHLIYINLLEAKEIGKLNVSIDLKSLASFIVSAWQGSLLRSKVARNYIIIDEFTNVLKKVMLK